jgi:hypothetical protein
VENVAPPVNLGAMKQAAALLAVAPASKLSPELLALRAALVADLPRLGEFAALAERVLRTAKTCKAPLANGPCKRFATKRDPMDQLWCDRCGHGLHPAEDLDVAPILRAVAALLFEA